jgi:hypothetical protein
MYQNFISLTLDDIPSNFIKFNHLNIQIDDQQMNKDKPLYLSIDTLHQCANTNLSDV